MVKLKIRIIVVKWICLQKSEVSVASKGCELVSQNETPFCRQLSSMSIRYPCLCDNRTARPNPSEPSQRRLS